MAWAQDCPAEVPVGTVILNPNGVCFPASPDHNVIDPVSGLPRVTKYDLCFFDSTVNSDDLTKLPVQCFPLGKPTPGGPNSVIQVTNASYFGGWPLTGTLYKGVLVTTGPTGVTRSSGSHGFFGVANSSPPRAAGSPVFLHP
jgi:hypothetical protein